MPQIHNISPLNKIEFFGVQFVKYFRQCFAHAPVPVGADLLLPPGCSSMKEGVLAVFSNIENFLVRNALKAVLAADNVGVRVLDFQKGNRVFQRVGQPLLSTGFWEYSWKI